MKKQILLTIALLFLCVSGFSKINETDKENWINLDYIIRGTTPFNNDDTSPEISLKLWKKFISVKIEGNYTNLDSLELDRIIKSFSYLTPEMTFSWCQNSEPSLTVYFTELNPSNNFGNKYISDHKIIETIHSNTPNQILNHKVKIRQVNMSVLYVNSETDSEIRAKSLWTGFARSIGGSPEGSGFKIGKLSVLGGELTELTDFDKFYFKTIYSPQFITDYALFIKSNYNLKESFQYLTDTETRSNILYTIQLIIFLILAYFSYQLFWVKRLEKKVKSTFARFHITGLIIFLPQIIGAAIILFPILLKTEHIKLTVGSGLILGIITFVFLFLGYFTTALIIYLIEHVIFKRIKNFKQRQLLRIFSVFTCFTIQATPFILIGKYAPVSSGNVLFSVFISILFIVTIRFLFFHDLHQKEIIRNQQNQKISTLEKLQTKFQLEAIQAKTNPHFLYNSLNTIASLAKQDANRAEDFALKLSKLLRIRLDENPSDEIQLQKEIETIELYLEIEKERIGDRFNYHFEIPEDAKTTIIPSNILLHLIENSIKHGISKTSGESNITIQVDKTENDLHFRVFDSGPDFPEKPIYGTGLKNILEKLDILYPNRYEFAIFNHPQKHVEIILKS